MRAVLLVVALGVAAPAMAEEPAPAPKKRKTIVIDCPESDPSCRVTATTPQAALLIPRSPQAKKAVESAGGDALEQVLER